MMGEVEYKLYITLGELILLQSNTNTTYSISSYHCEEVLILHNQPHPPPPILLNDTKVSRCKIYISRQHLEVVTKPNSVCQL